MPPQRYRTPSWCFAKATTRWANRAGRRFGAGGGATRAWAAGENRQASTTAVSGRRIRAYLGGPALHRKDKRGTSNEGATAAAQAVRSQTAATLRSPQERVSGRPTPPIYRS